MNRSGFVVSGRAVTARQTARAALMPPEELGHVFKPMEPFNRLLVIDKRYGSFPGSDEFKRAAVEAAKKIDLIAGDTSAPGCACANPAEAVRPRMTS